MSEPISREAFTLSAAEDTPYAFGQGCTWHGDPRTAALAAPEPWEDEAVLPPLACPHCGLPLIRSSSTEAWWYSARRNNGKIPEYEAMMRWSEGKCFPDFDTLRNAYRQAMEGEV